MIEQINSGIQGVKIDVECVEVIKDQWIHRTGMTDLLRISDTRVIEVGSISHRLIRELELIELVGEGGSYDVTVIVHNDFVENSTETPGQPLGWYYGTPESLSLEDIVECLKAGFNR